MIINIFTFSHFGTGTGIISSIVFIALLFNAAQEEKKKMGLKALGRHVGDLTIAEDYLILENRQIAYNQVTNLSIYVDEFTGMTKDFFWSYHGGNNEICFDYKNQHYSINYIIRNKIDYQHVEKLVALIEAKYPNR